MIQPSPGARRTKSAGRRKVSPAEALYGLFSAVASGAPRDISLTSAATLSTLERTGPRRITDLAVAQGVAQPSMTALVTALERSGLVERHGDPSDRRVTLVAVTSEGSEYVNHRRGAGAEVIAELINELPASEATTLKSAVPALVHLRDLYTQQRDPAPRIPKR
jgi:DNA-binding MarR family transcriptional regulator